MVIVDRIVAKTPDEFQDRALIDLTDFMLIEDKGMTGLFAYWRDLRIRSKGNALPTFDQLRWEPVVKLGMHHRVNVIDISPENPMAFHVEMQATLSYIRSGHNLKGTCIGDNKNQLHADGLQRDYVAVKQRGQPRYHDILNRVDGRWRAYRRLILPFAGADGRTVEKLLIGVRVGAPDVVPRDLRPRVPPPG